MRNNRGACSSVESEVEHLRPVERLRLEELKDARRVCESLASRVADLRIHVDDANDACGRVLAADTPLDQHPRNQLDSVNQRLGIPRPASVLGF